MNVIIFRSVLLDNSNIYLSNFVDPLLSVHFEIATGSYKNTCADETHLRQVDSIRKSARLVCRSSPSTFLSAPR